MVVVKLKAFEEIVSKLKGFRKIFILGCELGSGRCKNGGLKEALELSERLKGLGFNVVGVKSPGGTCILERIDGRERSLLKEAKTKGSEVIVSLACGAGTQLIAENVDVPVITGVTTLFIGAEREGRIFNEYCIACGDCIISDTGGICPVARCPKSLVNGPCGGAIEGQCEVDKEIPCIWYKIAERMKKLGTFKSLCESAPFKDYRKSVYPRRLILEEKS